MKRKPLSNRQSELLSGATGWDAEKIQRYRENLWKSGFDVPGMEGFFARAKRYLSTTARTVTTFAKATAKHVKAGCPNPPTEVIEARRAICKACPHWSGSRCKLCQCFTKAKTSWSGESCPDGRWEAVTVLSPNVPTAVGGSGREGIVEPGGVMHGEVLRVIGGANLLSPGGEPSHEADHDAHVGELSHGGQKDVEQMEHSAGPVDGIGPIHNVPLSLSDHGNFGNPEEKLMDRTTPPETASHAGPPLPVSPGAASTEVMR